MSQKWSPRPPIMPADFPYVWGSGLHLWPAPRTARSTRGFGQLEQVSLEPTKIGCDRSGPPAPRSCRLTFHTSGGAGCTFGRLPGPPDRPVVLGFRGSRAIQNPCLSHFGTPAVPTACLQMSPNSSILETLPDNSRILILSALRLFYRLLASRKNARQNS